MSDTTEYPAAAKHCGCLGHRANRPERHIAEPDVAPSFVERNRSAVHDLMAELVGNPFIGGAR